MMSVVTFLYSKSKWIDFFYPAPGKANKIRKHLQIQNSESNNNNSVNSDGNLFLLWIFYD